MPRQGKQIRFRIVLLVGFFWQSRRNLVAEQGAGGGMVGELPGFDLTHRHPQQEAVGRFDAAKPIGLQGLWAIVTVEVGYQQY